MNKIAWVIGGCLMLNSALATEEVHRVWLNSECYQLHLSMWDKMNLGKYHAKYVVTDTEFGHVYVAEKDATEDSNSAEVNFPDDFYEEKTKLHAGINCTDRSYTWAIYIDGVLKDEGAITFERHTQYKKKKK